MKAKEQDGAPCDDLFRMWLKKILDQKHPLYQLAPEINWSVVEKQFEGLHSEEGRPSISL